MNNTIRTFVPHVKKGYEDRFTHISEMLESVGLDFEFMLDGDISDIDQQRLDLYFKDSTYCKAAHTSCALKHILIYKTMVEQNIELALVVEDDIFLNKKFNSVLSQALGELKDVDTPYYVGLEATCMKIVPKSQRSKGRVTHRGNYVQCTGAYLINLSAAKALYNKIIDQKCHLAIDLYLNEQFKEGLYDLYWSYPPVAEQGSHNGKMTSSITPAYKKSLTRIFKRRITMIYKRIVSNFK